MISDVQAHTDPGVLRQTSEPIPKFKPYTNFSGQSPLRRTQESKTVLA
jgi:hypothetical protein